MAEVGTGGLASPIVIPLDIAATATGASLFAHGGFVWNKSIQNAKDTIQKSSLLVEVRVRVIEYLLMEKILYLKVHTVK